MFRKISRLDSLIFLYNIVNCEDNDAHADLTYEELLKVVSKKCIMDDDMLAACLYCCNMNYENEEIGFWHPYDMEFKQYVQNIIGHDYAYDYVYNQIVPKVKGYEKNKKKTNSRRANKSKSN